MIRKLEESDLPRIMQIWLSANKEAHGFIKKATGMKILKR